MGKIYVIFNGRNPDTGVRNLWPERFTDWGTASKWVNGIENAKFKGFEDTPDREDKIEKWLKKVKTQLGLDGQDFTDEDRDFAEMEAMNNAVMEVVNGAVHGTAAPNGKVSETATDIMPAFDLHCKEVGITPYEMNQVLQTMFCNIMDYITARRSANTLSQIEEEEEDRMPWN